MAPEREGPASPLARLRSGSRAHSASHSVSAPAHALQAVRWHFSFSCYLFFFCFEFPAVNVFCKQSRNNKRSLSVMMGENSGQKPLLSWEQRPFVSAIRSLIPLGPQVPTEANKCVHNSPCEEVGYWTRPGLHLPICQMGVLLFLSQGGRGGWRRQCLGKPQARSSRGNLGSRGGAWQGPPCAARAPRLCARCRLRPPFPEGSFVTST